MGAEKSSMATTTRDRDRELLIPVAAVEGTAAPSSMPSSSSSSSLPSPHHAGREVISLSTLSQFGVSINHHNSFSLPLFFRNSLNLVFCECIGVEDLLESFFLDLN